MKIIGGKLKGRNFYRSADLRPTQNITRKAIFDIVGQDMEGCTVLDLFAGSGAIGLEALSRGAQKVYFVEKNAKYSEVIKENLTLFSFDSQQSHELLSCDAYAAIKIFFRKKIKFDLIVCDPPYSRGLAKKALKVLEGYDIVQPNSFVVIEHHRSEILPENMGRFRLFRRRKYGATVLSIYSVENISST